MPSLMKDLPLPVLEEIVSYLPVVDFKSFISTCHALAACRWSSRVVAQVYVNDHQRDALGHAINGGLRARSVLNRLMPLVDESAADRAYIDAVAQSNFGAISYLWRQVNLRPSAQAFSRLGRQIRDLMTLDFNLDFNAESFSEMMKMALTERYERNRELLDILSAMQSLYPEIQITASPFEYEEFAYGDCCGEGLSGRNRFRNDIWVRNLLRMSDGENIAQFTKAAINANHVDFFVYMVDRFGFHLDPISDVFEALHANKQMLNHALPKFKANAYLATATALDLLETPAQCSLLAKWYDENDILLDFDIMDEETIDDRNREYVLAEMLKLFKFRENDDHQ